MNVLIYPTESGGIAVVHPTPEFLAEHTLAEVAEKSVPAGVPYRVVPASSIPADRTFRAAWEADFTNPDGFGGRA